MTHSRRRPSHPIRPPRRRLRILVADDEAMIVSSLQRYFTRRGHLVLTATDAEEALELSRAHVFDAALVDVRMPGGGSRVVEELRRDPRFEGRLVMITGASPDDPSLQELSGVRVLHKPFELGDLADLVEGARSH